jgi:hypothetical protein
VQVGRVWRRPKRCAALVWGVSGWPSRWSVVVQSPVSPYEIMSQGQGCRRRRYARVPRQRPRNTTPNKQPLSPLRCAAAPQHSSALAGTLSTTLPYRSGMLRDELRALHCASSRHALVVLTARHGRRARLLLPQDGRLFLSSPCLQPGAACAKHGPTKPTSACSLQPAACSPLSPLSLCRPLLSEPTEPTESTHHRPA